MKNVICFVVFAILFGCVVTVNASKLEIGAKFDIKGLPSDNRTAHNTIIAFVPSLTYDCEYASMLMQSFYYYFDRGMAFELSKKKPTVKIFFVVYDEMNEAKSTQNIIGWMNVVYDPKGEIFEHYGVKGPEGKNSDSTVVLLDSNEKIVHLDEDYGAQGEHLKPLESKLKETNGIAIKVNSASAAKPLKVGEKAIDFSISKDKRLSDFRGKVILLSFYPAAFSGSFPKPVETNLLPAFQPRPVPHSNSEQTAYVKPGNIGIPSVTEPLFLNDPAKTVSKVRLDDRDLMLCSVQLTSIARTVLRADNYVKRVVISSSTPSLLEQWGQALGTMNIIYANDPDYSVSRQYLSYNPAGYNNRVSVIIDRKGKVAYVDDSFDAADEAVLNAKIKELISKK